MSAGLAMLNALCEEGIYEELEKKNTYLCNGLEEAARAAGVAVSLNRIASLGCGFFTEGPVEDYESAVKADTGAYALYFREMLARGVYLAPSQFEACFVGSAHQKEDLDRTVEAAFASLGIVAENCALRK